VNATIQRLLTLSLLALTACGTTLPDTSPPLADIDEPLDLRAEPDDEARRQQLPAGAFAGLRVDDARDTLAAKLDAPSALRIVEVVENSPAQAAGLQVGDVLLEVTVAGRSPRALQRPGEWRQIELDTPPGTKLVMIVDRAGREARTELTLTPRLRPAARGQVERFREEARVGVVLRTATEVEARAANLGPGGGAVIVGLSRGSPWRTVGLQFGDLIAAVDGAAITHPDTLLAVLRDPGKQAVQLTVRRGEATSTLDAPLSQRAGELNSFSLPILFSYESKRGRTEWSLLYGLLGYESTAAAWDFTLLWLISFGGGDADRLLEVDR
jgi:C-terminal processing protease CtpA/Prc